jgi:hypothetical protein
MNLPLSEYPYLFSPLSALSSGRNLKVSRCLEQVSCRNLDLFVWTNISPLHQLEAYDCLGTACTILGPKPSARTTLIIQGAVNNLENALPHAYAKMLPTHNDTTVVDVAVSFEM